MLRDVEMQGPPALMTQQDKHKQYPERRRRYGEEIHRDQLSDGHCQTNWVGPVEPAIEAF